MQPQYDLWVHRRFQPESVVWLITMALAGVGCAFVGPYLHIVSLRWHLRDNQAGLILSCVFVGSFFGSMLMARDVGRNLRIGSLSTTSGLLLFAAAANYEHVFPLGAASLSIAGFGLGQLMSSINLMTGAVPTNERARALANVGTAWCLGAVFSPMLTGALAASLSPIRRLVLFAPLYLLAALASLFRSRSTAAPAVVVPSQTLRLSPPALLWAISFLLYGGVEAGVAGWLPTFTLRYQILPSAWAQWITSVFWCGLITSRLLTALFVTPRNQRFVIRTMLLASAACVLWLITLPASLSFVAGIACVGVCLGPIFPLYLATSLELHLTPQVMGIILASCGLGNAIFPSLLGAVSNQSSLRVAMLVPLASLLGLCLLYSKQTSARAAATAVRTL